MRKVLLPHILICVALSGLTAQQSGCFFKAITPDQVVLGENTRRGAFPKKFDTYQLNYEALKSTLATAPWEFTGNQKKCVIGIPLPGGQIEDFSVVEIAMLDEAGRAECPYIHCYAGVSLQDGRRTVRLSTTQRGFRAMIMQPDYDAAFVEPYAWGQTEYYLAYKYQDSADDGLSQLNLRVETKADGELTFGESSDELYVPEAENRGPEVAPLQLKIFRLAVTCTGEFGQDHGTSKAEVFQAETEYVNMISAIYERDMALRLQLIAASQNATFFDPDTDPYTGTTIDGWFNQAANVLAQYVNINSHDVGHCFARYINGGALGLGAIGVVCQAGKDGGCSGGNGVGNYGARFIGVVGQEIGHELSCGHTWNNCGDNAQRDGTVSFEPGSGSTIMAYPGSCGADNIQNFADLYFHAGAINKIKTFYTFGATCGSYLQTSNNNPTVTLNYPDNLFIPISTPFELTGSASDIDGDSLSYCWEEMDLGPPAPLSAPAGDCPIFRTRFPVAVPNRYFPRLQTVLINGFDKTEQLPTYTRDLKFRLTARDNVLNGGGLGWADVAFMATDLAGPFLVTSPNTTSDTWTVGQLQEVDWDVANTYNAPVNCKKVNIRLSTDGGLTYPITLASNVENDGKQVITVPNNVGTALRVRVDAVDNVFYDISNANFKIQQASQASLTMGLSSDGATICLPDNFSTDILSAAILGYSDPIQLDLVGNVPPGAVASFSATSLMPGQTGHFSVDLSNVDVEGIYSFNIHAVSGANQYTMPITLVLRRNNFSGLALQQPVDGSTNAPLVQTLHWNPGLDADTYDVQLSTTPAFTTLIASKTGTALDSFKVNLLLEKGTAYYWRVRPNNECGSHEWTEPFFFSTYAENCKEFESNDLPKNLTASNVATVETKVTVNLGGQISDVNISKIQGYHEFFKDLEAHLISPDGVDVLLWKDKCGNFNGNFNFGLDDAAPGAFPCPPNNTGNSYRPVNPLSPFYGLNSTGAWTFRLKDNVIGSGGVLDAFTIEFCASLSVNPPFLVNNNIMPLPSGTNKVITPDFLRVDDSDNAHVELKYTVLTEPDHGYITQDGVGQLHPGDMFTQADIDGGRIRFYDYGNGGGAPDGFKFVVSDGHGGFFGTPKFLAQPLVNATEPGRVAIDFVMYPNPATETVQISFNESLDSKTQVQLFDLAGRRIDGWEMSAGNAAMSFNVNALPRGVYFVSVKNAKGSGVKKLTVQ